MKKSMLYSKINTAIIINHGDTGENQAAGNCRVRWKNFKVKSFRDTKNCQKKQTNFLWKKRKAIVQKETHLFCRRDLVQNIGLKWW